MRVKHSFLIYILIFFVSSNLFSQENTPDELFNLAEKNYEYQQYNIALKYYLKYYPHDSADANLNLRIGELYLITDVNKPKALIYLIRAKAGFGKADETLQLKIAKAYFYNYDFDNAISTASEISMETKNMSFKRLAGNLLQQILSASTLYAEPVEAKIVHLGPNVNNKYSNFNPFITDDETKIYYSSRNKRNNSNLFVANFDSTSMTWLKPTKLKRLSSTDDDIMAGIEPNQKHLLMHFGELSSQTDITISSYSPNGYTEPLDIGPNISSDQKEEGAFLNNTEDTIYFSSRRNGGQGGMDLYMSIKLPDLTWGIPINLGEKINSSQDENYPFLSPDGKTLYYSSKGFNTLGGYDLFYSTKDSTGAWQYPTNLGYPVNDIYDNKTISFAKNMRYAYTSYVRPLEGEGEYDLYKVIFTQREADFLVYTGIVYYSQNRQNIPITEKSTDITVNVNDKRTDELVGTYAINEKSAKLTIALKPGNYILTIESAEYQTYKEKINIADVNRKNKIVQKDFVLKLKN